MPDSSAIDKLIPKVAVGEQIVVEGIPFTVVATDRAGITLDGRFSFGEFGAVVHFRSFYWKVTEVFHLGNHLRVVPWGPTRAGVRVVDGKVVVAQPRGRHGIDDIKEKPWMATAEVIPVPRGANYWVAGGVVVGIAVLGEAPPADAERAGLDRVIAARGPFHRAVDWTSGHPARCEPIVERPVPGVTLQAVAKSSDPHAPPHLCYLFK